ncbi:tyrosine protein phosphatase yvh1 [Microsporum canis]
MDRVNGYNIYIGSLFALRNQDALKQANITHVISVVGPKERPSAISSLQTYDVQGHLILDLLDQDQENILQHFPQANRFIEGATADGSAVLVHWSGQYLFPYIYTIETPEHLHMHINSDPELYSGLGISRSATIVLAYMLYQARPRLTPGGALFVLRSSRPGCQPNAGFTEQLALYHQMGCPDSLEDQHLYQLFLDR